MEDACREYLSSLEDLTFNSKPHINMLTILAEENHGAAKDIVAIIEAQISKATPAEKLPVLYLVDSIVKNVGGEYLAVFAKNLVTSFICVFEKVDEGTRKSLFKLRSTWDDVFPLKKLYALDVRVNSVDPAWPIKPLPPTVNASSIHVNPRFLIQAEESSPRASPPRPPAPAPSQLSAPPPQPAAVSMVTASEASLTQEQLIRQQLLAKQKQLLELQQKKIELELEQTKAQLAGNFVLNPPAPLPPSPSSCSSSHTHPNPKTPPAAAPPVTRDPRLNRTSGSGSRSKEQVSAPSSSPRPKDQKDHAPQTAAPRLKDHAPLTSAPRPAAPRSNKDHQAAPLTSSAPPTRPPGKREPPTERRVTEKQKGGGAGVPRREAGSSLGGGGVPRRDVGSSLGGGVPRREAGSSLGGGGVPRREAGLSEHQHIKDKSKSKSPSPIILPPPPKGRTSDLKKDPRLLLLRKRLPEKTGGEEEQKEKKRFPERKEREREEASGGGAKKLANGSLGKHEQRGQSGERGGELKTGGGNARTNARKRSRSPTPPPFNSSPKRKERRRSPSLSPPPPSSSSHTKPGGGGGAKPRRAEEQRKTTPRKRTKDSPRLHHSSSSSSDTKEPPLHSRRSAWEETKHLKQSEEAHGKCGPQRHLLQKSYSTPPPARPAPPRTPKHRLSVDANLQIPDVLNSASKRDLLRRASKRLESGEISQEDFLNVAHQIKQLFQYREEKKMAPPTSSSQSPPPGSPAPHQADAQMLYYQHKSKLRRTQVAHRSSAGEEEPEEEEEEEPEEGAELEERGKGPSPHPAARSSRERDRTGERSSKEREEQQTPMIEEYNHGKDFPSRKALQGLRFRRKADLRDTAEREWTSPLSERQRYEERGGGGDVPTRSGYDAPRRLPPPQHAPPPPPPPPPRKCPSPAPSGPAPSGPAPSGPALAFERERLSPLQTDSAGGSSPAPRFESPNSQHSDDLDLPPPPPPHHHPAPPRSILKVRSSPPPVPHTPLPPHPTPPPQSSSSSSSSSRYPPRPPQRYNDNEGGHYDNGPHPPQQGGGGGRFEGGPPIPPHHGPMRGFDGPPHPRFDAPIGQQQQPHRFDEHFDGPMRRFDGPGPQGFQQQHRPPMQRFDGPAHMGPGPIRFDGPGQPGPIRFDGPGQPGPMRFDGPNQPGPMRFDGPAQPGPMRFDGPAQPGPMRFDGPNQPGPIRFDGPGQPGQIRFDGPAQPGPIRFDGPGQPGQIRFDGPAQPGLRFDMSNHPHQPFHQPMAMHFEQAPPRYPGPPHSLHPPMRPMGGPMGGPGPGPFSSMPGHQYPFPGQTGPPGFYNQGPPQQVNMVPNMTQTFLPQNTQPFTQTAAPPLAADSHFGQMDVNELLTKLINTGIIPAATPPTHTHGSTEPSPSAPVEEEEEEEEEEDENVPDITSFNMEELKQRYESVVCKLYTGIQCYSCGMRFTASQTDVYADHLDWHYRHNRSEKDVSRKVTHRRWYYSLTDWIEFEEVADLEERSKSQFFEKVNEEEVQKSQEASKQKDVISSVKAATDVVDESCEICAEPFEMYWEEEEEEWHLKNAIRVDDKTYHPSCYEDYKNTCSFGEATPSPSTQSTQHPLSAFKQEDTPPTSCQFADKQEEEMEEEEEGGAKEIKQEVVEEEVVEEAGQTPTAPL